MPKKKKKSNVRETYDWASIRRVIERKIEEKSKSNSKSKPKKKKK